MPMPELPPEVQAKMEKLMEDVVDQGVAIAMLVADKGGLQLTDDEVLTVRIGAYGGTAVLMKTLSEKGMLSGTGIIKFLTGGGS